MLRERKLVRSNPIRGQMDGRIIFYMLSFMKEEDIDSTNMEEQLLAATEATEKIYRQVVIELTMPISAPVNKRNRSKTMSDLITGEIEAILSNIHDFPINRKKAANFERWLKMNSHNLENIHNCQT